MKTILIATDFSTVSRNAAVYGLHLAKAINAKVILFNAYKISSGAFGLGIDVPRHNVRDEVMEKLLHEANQVTYINMPGLRTSCEEGEPREAIIRAANSEKADFIITGMKDHGKDFKKIFGSTPTSLAKYSNIPVIIVPEDAKFKTLDTLVFAGDDINYGDKNGLEHLVTITGLFKSKLYVVKVVQTRSEESLKAADASEDLRKVFRILDCSIEYLLDADISHGLNTYIRKRNADMLVMMPHKHDRLERFFIKSETKDMIFHTHIPLLVLPENGINETGYQETTATSVNSPAY